MASVGVFSLFYHLPFLTGILAFRTLGLRFYLMRGTASYLNEGLLFSPIFPESKHNQVQSTNSEQVGIFEPKNWSVKIDKKHVPITQWQIENIIMRNLVGRVGNGWVSGIRVEWSFYVMHTLGHVDYSDDVTKILTFSDHLLLSNSFALSCICSCQKRPLFLSLWIYRQNSVEITNY